MRLHITTDDTADRDYGRWFVKYFEERAAVCRFRVHAWADDPVSADAILLLARGDEYSTAIRHHPLVRSHYRKTFVYDVKDRPIPFLPGLYCSLPRREFSPTRHVAVGYIAPINPHVAIVAAAPTPPNLLFSFVGADNSPVRRRLIAHARGWADRPDVLVQVRFGWKNRGKAEAERGYAETLVRSRFVLCPRGIGTASFRLFEAMELGRAPVILADGWVAPIGPDWESFSLRVAERDVPEVPRLLDSRAADAAEMGRLARRAWEEWFAPDVQFHRTAEAVNGLLDGGRAHGRCDRWGWPFRAGYWRSRDVGRALARATASRLLRTSSRCLRGADRK